MSKQKIWMLVSNRSANSATKMRWQIKRGNVPFQLVNPDTTLMKVKDDHHTRVWLDRIKRDHNVVTAKEWIGEPVRDGNTTRCGAIMFAGEYDLVSGKRRLNSHQGRCKACRTIVAQQTAKSVTQQANISQQAEAQALERLAKERTEDSVTTPRPAPDRGALVPVNGEAVTHLDGVKTVMKRHAEEMLELASEIESALAALDGIDELEERYARIKAERAESRKALTHFLNADD